jgi:hypothetical protein
MMKNRQITVLVLLFVFKIFLFADSEGIIQDIDYSINWQSRQLEIAVENSISNFSKPIPSIKFNLEKDIEQDLPYLLLKCIETIIIDSKTTGKDYIRKHPTVIASIYNLSSELLKTQSVFTEDLQSLKTKYTLDIYPSIADIFIPHTRISSPQISLNFTPSADFSGIVIYVDEYLPMYGKQSTGMFNPSLFPKIFDEKLNIIVDTVMIDPNVIKNIGTMGFQTLTDSLDIARIGQNPIELKARRIFGINNTDLIISDRDADRILSREHNLDLIRAGKILIIHNNID